MPLSQVSQLPIGTPKETQSSPCGCKKIIGLFRLRLPEPMEFLSENSPSSCEQVEMKRSWVVIGMPGPSQLSPCTGPCFRSQSRHSGKTEAELSFSELKKTLLLKWGWRRTLTDNGKYPQRWRQCPEVAGWSPWKPTTTEWAAGHDNVPHRGPSLMDLLCLLPHLVAPG